MQPGLDMGPQRRHGISVEAATFSVCPNPGKLDWDQANDRRSATNHDRFMSSIGDEDKISTKNQNSLREFNL